MINLSEKVINEELIDFFYKNKSKILETLNSVIPENVMIKNENYRTDIVDKCNAIIDKKHRFKNILPIVEQFLDMKLTLNSSVKTQWFPWP